MGLFRKKSITLSMSLTKKEGHKLEKSLTSFNIMTMAVGGSIGAGIFSITANTAAYYSGPAVVLSFLIASILCGLVSICYCEFATIVPISGSAYSFSYVALGEFIAWLVGWNLILEILFTTAIITKAWSSYLYDLLRMLNINLKPFIEIYKGTGTIFNINFDYGAIFIVLFIISIILLGVKKSSKVINIITVIKVAVILFLIAIGIFFISKQNYHPFIPPTQSTGTDLSSSHSLWSYLLHISPSSYGINGVITGGAIVFFAFIGFDVVVSSAEETKNPKRSIPIGMISGIFILALLYISVSAVITGMVPFKELKNYAISHSTSPTLATAFEIHNIKWAGIIIAFGAVIGLIAVLLLFVYGSTRIIFAISRDGLLPKWLSKTSPKTKVPKNATILVALFVIFASCFFNLSELAQLVNLGTLSAFAIISFSIPNVRKNKEFKPIFKVPFSPFLPVLTGLCCIWLILNLPISAFYSYGAWIILGLIIYFTYSRKHSHLHKHKR